MTVYPTLGDVDTAPLALSATKLVVPTTTSQHSAMSILPRWHRPWDARFLGWLRRSPLSPVLALLGARRVAVGGGSMYPLLHPGDRILVNRLAFLAEGPRRGDVVLVRPTEQIAEGLVKLVAGLPGERVAVARDRLWIDGRPLLFHRPMVGSLPGTWHLGPNAYFLLSYAVAVGTDSRHFGPVPRDALRGRAWLVYWPPSRRRSLFQVPLDLGGWGTDAEDDNQS